MRTGQREFALVVIEGYFIPIGRLMTGAAIRAELAIMMVILLMAGETICRCSLEDAIEMTGFAIYLRVMAL